MPMEPFERDITFHEDIEIDGFIDAPDDEIEVDESEIDNSLLDEDDWGHC